MNKELGRLRKLIGNDAYRALKERGASLKIWRNSSPHNWWVEGRRGKTYWHSGEGWFDRPNLKLFQKVEDSGERVIAYWGSDSGQACLSTYVLRKL
jgi:hypothetical protein